MAFFAEKDCLTSIKSKGTIIVKDCIFRDSPYTFCIPTYKRSCDLKAAIDSVFAQQTAIPFNVIVADNNPVRGDETELLINNYYSDKNNLKYIKNVENLGMAGNWNRLILECQTDYLILLHDDDVLYPFFLNKLDYIKKRYPEVSALNCGKFEGNNPIINKSKINSGTIYKHVAKTNFAKFLFGPPSGCLFKVSDLLLIGGFDNDVYPSIDYVCIEKLCLRDKIVFTTADELMFYRVGDNATAKLDTQLKWLDVDYRIKTELKEILGISNFVYKMVLWFEMKMRLRGIKNLNTKIEYHHYKPGSKFFCVLYAWYERYLRKQIKVVK